MKALFESSDPYECDGLLGIYETEEQKKRILNDFEKELRKAYPEFSDNYFKQAIKEVKEVDIPIGIYGPYFTCERID